MADPIGTMPDERRRHILEQLDRDGRVLAANLAQRFGISEDTARRDLRELSAIGLCRRVYGGALPLSSSGSPIAEREREQPARKAALGRAGAVLVAQAMRPQEALFLDVGSTNLAVARALPPGLGITVATNAPGVAAVLVGLPGIELVVLGGRIDPRTGAAHGLRTMRDLAAMRIGLALLGACALDAEAGLGAFDLEDAEFKREAAEIAATIAVVATSEKLATAAPFTVMPAARLSHLVVEADAPSSLLDPFAGLGIAIHRASAP